MHMPATGKDGDMAGFHRLSPSSLKSMYTSRVIAILVLGAVVSACFMVPVLDDLMPLVVLGYAALALYMLISPIVFYKRYRYRFDDDKVEVRRGVVWVSHTLIPLERIHQIDVVKGPVNRMFGLADISITTAGGTSGVQFLEEDVAEEIVEHINNTVVALLKDRV